MIIKYLGELKEVLDSLDHNRIGGLIEKIIEVREKEKNIFIIGNGGSAANSSHWACDLTKGTLKRFYDTKHKRVRVTSLTDNVASITALANDLTYDEIFSQQLRNLVKPGDLLIVLTGSGRSRNVINAVDVAKRMGAYVFSLIGFDGGEVILMSDNYLLIPSRNYGIIEDIQLSIGHIVTEGLKNFDSDDFLGSKQPQSENPKISQFKLD